MNIFEFRKEGVHVLLFGILIIWIALNLQGCSFPMPPVDVTMWSGDSATGGMTRSQENSHISCTDKRFDDYTCMTYEDIKAIYAVMLQCKQWGPPVATPKEVKSMADKNSEVINNVISAPTKK